MLTPFSAFPATKVHFRLAILSNSCSPSMTRLLQICLVSTALMGTSLIEFTTCRLRTMAPVGSSWSLAFTLGLASNFGNLVTFAPTSMVAVPTVKLLKLLLPVMIASSESRNTVSSRSSLVFKPLKFWASRKLETFRCLMITSWLITITFWLPLGDWFFHNFPSKFMLFARMLRIISNYCNIGFASQAKLERSQHKLILYRAKKRNRLGKHQKLITIMSYTSNSDIS